MLQITVNGDVVTVPDPCTVDDLLERYDLGGQACAVEINTRVVPKARHVTHRLSGGDVVELVTMVGGG